VLNANRPVNEVQLETNVKLTQTRRVQVGDIVSKSGRMTAVTRGSVDGVGQYTLTYAVGTRTIAGFKVVAEDADNPHNLEISAGGDSGALWFGLADSKAVGLHFAGETDPAPGAEHALACHLDDVLTQLDVTLLPTGVVPPAPFEPEATDALDFVTDQGDVTRMLVDCVARLARILEATADRQPRRAQVEAGTGRIRRKSKTKRSLAAARR
jgi:hypothetical protein